MAIENDNVSNSMFGELEYWIVLDRTSSNMPTDVAQSFIISLSSINKSKFNSPADLQV